MRAFITGATGFVGGRVARALIERGDEVTALVRRPDAAADLAGLGIRLAPGDITDPSTLTLDGFDAVYHIAAWYEVGIADDALMQRINVGGTQNVLDAAVTAGVPRIVYCSTLAVFGLRPLGDVADETTPCGPGTTSAYERTKTEAHRLVQQRAAQGAPVVTVMPGAVYGPGDTSMVAMLFRLYAKRRLIVCPFLSTEFSWVSVADLADGILAAHDKGRPGQEYILGGENASIRTVLQTMQQVTGIRAPRGEIPGRLLRLSKPFGPLAGKLMHAGPKILSEGLASMGGSWMGSSAKAEREIGYVYRSIADAMPETIEWFKER